MCEATRVCLKRTSGRFLPGLEFGPLHPSLGHVGQVLAELEIGAFLGKLEKPFCLLSAEFSLRPFHGVALFSQRTLPCDVVKN